MSEVRDPQVTNQSSFRITVPEGRFASPSRNLIDRLRGRFGMSTNTEQNGHNVTTHEFTINGHRRTIELVHQVRSGDCILANFLNTASVELDGHLPMTINETRQAAIRLRRE